jgi:hypothetical protein
MSNLITANVWRHLGWQAGTAVAVAGVAALAHVDYSALGPYAVSAQMFAAAIGAIVNEALGAAPKS